MTDTPLRLESIVSYRRYVMRTIIGALTDVFSSLNYAEKQFRGLKITNKYPLAQVDYPALVVEFEDSVVVNAGVGHEEWFDDADGELRKWFHRRFEGTLHFSLYALSPLDLDMFADALIEVLAFGRLQNTTEAFFDRIYGDPQQQQALVFNQLHINTDELEGQGNNATLAPWSPEDTMVYSTGYSVVTHGGFYNTVPSKSWIFVRAVDLTGYVQDEVTLDGHFELSPPPNPHPDAHWTQQYHFEDSAQGESFPRGEGHVSGVETLN